MRRAVCAFVLLVGCVACSGGEVAVRQAGTAEVSPAPFVERAAESGLDFVHFNGMHGEFYYPEIAGSGGALFDYDRDGDLDVYLVQGAMLVDDVPLERTTFPPHGPLTDRLFRNELAETGALRFVDVTDAAGISSPGYGMGVAAGDYDADGWIDLYVTNFGDNLLLRNRGDGTFEDVTLASGTSDPRWSASAAFVDYDGDGRLDLFVAEYLDYTLTNHKPCYSPTSVVEYCGPNSFPPIAQRLFRNRGDGTFEDVSTSSRIGLRPAAGLGVVTADLNDDGWADFYVASDGRANQLWINRGDGTFEDRALFAGCALNRDGHTEASMGIDAADVDGDGDPDLFMTHLTSETNTLYANRGDGTFDDVTAALGLAIPSHRYTGFGTAFLDYDGDGWLDVYIANGAVKALEERQAEGSPYPLAQRNQLFHNVGGQFVDVTAESGPALEPVEVGRGVATGDVDNDGDPDLLVTNNSGPVRLLLNESERRGGWLGLRLTDPSGGIDRLGSRVRVRLDDGRTLSRWVFTAGSYVSSRDPRLLFGLGGAGVSAVEIRWPDGSLQTIESLETNRYHEIRQTGEDE